MIVSTFHIVFIFFLSAVIVGIRYSPWAQISMDSLLEASTHISDDVGTQIRDDGSRALWKNSEQLGVSENWLNPIVPNGFAHHYPVFKWLAIIGNTPNIFRQTQLAPFVFV